LDQTLNSDARRRQDVTHWDNATGGEMVRTIVFVGDLLIDIINASLYLMMT